MDWLSSAVTRLARATVNTIATWKATVDPDQGLAPSSAFEQRFVGLIRSWELAAVPCIDKALSLDPRIGPSYIARQRLTRGIWCVKCEMSVDEARHFT
jgi:hypothetical protein